MNGENTMDPNVIDEELMRKIIFEMMFEEKTNNKKETYNDVQMVGRLLKVLENNL